MVMKEHIDAFRFFLLSGRKNIQGKRFGVFRADNYPAHLAFSLRETAAVSRRDNAAVSRSENAY